MKIGDEVLILETASEEKYHGWPWWDSDMNYSVGTTGYVGRIDYDGTAYVTFSKVPAGKNPLGSGGWWWKVEDLRVIPPTKWRRQKCA